MSMTSCGSGSISGAPAQRERIEVGQRNRVGVGASADSACSHGGGTESAGSRACRRAPEGRRAAAPNGRCRARPRDAELLGDDGRAGVGRLIDQQIGPPFAPRLPQVRHRECGVDATEEHRGPATIGIIAQRREVAPRRGAVRSSRVTSGSNPRCAGNGRRWSSGPADAMRTSAPCRWKACASGTTGSRWPYAGSVAKATRVMARIVLPPPWHASCRAPPYPALFGQLPAPAAFTNQSPLGRAAGPSWIAGTSAGRAAPRD